MTSCASRLVFARTVYNFLGSAFEARLVGKSRIGSDVAVLTAYQEKQSPFQQISFSLLNQIAFTQQMLSNLNQKQSIELNKIITFGLIASFGCVISN